MEFESHGKFQKLTDVKTLGVVPFNVLYRFDEMGFRIPLFYNNETRKYINIQYTTIKTNNGL